MDTEVIHMGAGKMAEYLDFFNVYPESRAIDTKNFPLVWLNCCSRNGSRGYPSYALE